MDLFFKKNIILLVEDLCSYRHPFADNCIKDWAQERCWGSHFELLMEDAPAPASFLGLFCWYI